MDLKSFSKKQISGLIIFLILLIAIPITFYLAKKTQVFKSKATQDPYSTLDISSSEEGRSVTRIGGNEFHTDTQHLKIKLRDIQSLTQP